MTTFGHDPGIALDQASGDVMPERFSPLLEVGRTGLRRTGGYVDEEFLPQLRGRKAARVYREMGDNEAVVGAFLFAIENLIRQVEWRVEPASSRGEDKQNAEFLDQNMNDMQFSWSDHLSEALTMNQYGWALCNIVYKKRVGPWEPSLARKSKYTDGRFGWRKIQLRAQETLYRWAYDEAGEVIGMMQMAPPDYRLTPVPLSRCVHYRTTTVKDNPEGYSLLRRSYRPWFMKKRHEEYEAIGVNRDLAGLPKATVPSEYLAPGATHAQKQMVEAMRKAVRTVRRDEQEGLIWPAQYDPDTKQPLFDFSLVNSGGSRQFNTDGIITRYKAEILMPVLADFIVVGHEGTGTYSLHTDKTGLFRTAVNSIPKNIAATLNRDAVPKLFAINGMKPAELPRIVPNDVDAPDLIQLGSFMAQMAQAGVQWFPDPVLEAFIRDAARLPKLDPDVEAVHLAQQRQTAVLGLAQQKLAMVQTEQQVEQGEMALNQQALGMATQAAGAAGQQQTQQAQQLAQDNGTGNQNGGPPQADNSDIDRKRAQVGLGTDKVKQAQEKAKLQALRNTPKRAPNERPPSRGRRR